MKRLPCLRLVPRAAKPFGANLKVLDLAALGGKHARGAVAEALYVHAGIDRTRPISIYGEVVQRCNYKCRYCDHWRRTTGALEAATVLAAPGE